MLALQEWVGPYSCEEAGMAIHMCNSNVRETETGLSPMLAGQPD